LTLLGLSTVTLAVLTPSSSFRTLWEWQPGTSAAALWLLTATALLVVWYQVPVHEWQRAIMLGLAPYLLVFVALLGLLQRHGWMAKKPIATAETLAYLGLILFWTWAAWRREAAREQVVQPRVAA
jgi:hypothetical protein